MQRRTLAAHGLTKVEAVEVGSPGDLRAATARLGMPGVVKPRRQSDGRGIAFVCSDGDLDDIVQRRTGWSDLLYEQRIASAISS